ncbi:MAG: hypothetical protein WKG07_11785 [Hymenobacter sp.]
MMTTAGLPLPWPRRRAAGTAASGSTGWPEAASQAICSAKRATSTCTLAM